MRANARNANLADIGGFILQYMESRIDCPACKERLSCSGDSRVLLFIRLRNGAGLHYPSTTFISLLSALHDFCVGVFKTVNLKSNKISRSLYGIIKPYVMEVPFLKCPLDGSHTAKLCTLIVERFVHCMLRNHARKVTGSVVKRWKPTNRPRSRRVLRLG